MKNKKTNVRILFLTILLFSFLIRLYVALTSVEILVEKILIDDFFYMLSISKYIAKGSFGIYNGVDKTNGFQPLWAILTSIVHFISKDTCFVVNLVLIFASLVDIFTLIIIFVFTRKIFNEKTAFLTTILYGLNPFIVFQTLNGLEVVIDVFFVVAIFYSFYRLRKNLTLKNSLILGLILGLALLSRTDNIFLLTSILLLVVYENRKKLNFMISRCFIIGFCCLFVFSPFILWNLLTFGKITQSSYITRYNMNHGIFPFFDLKPPKSFQDHFKLIFETTYRGLGIILHHFGVINFDIFSPSAIFPTFIVVMLLFSVKELKKLTPLAIHAIFLFSFYCFYFFGVQIRYLTPSIPMFFILFSVGFQKFTKKFFNREISSFLIFTLFLTIVFLNAIKQWERGYLPWQKEMYKDALWIKENTRETDIIGGFNSGITMYFSERRVINLDGVLNFEAIEAISNKSVIKYMKSKNITFWVDNVFFNQTVVDAYRRGFRFNVIEENLWKDILGEGKENITLIKQKEDIYKHLRGFEMLVVFFKAKII